MKKIQAFFSTALGSWVKTFLTTILALWLAELSAGHDIFSFDMVLVKKLLTAAVISTLPVLLNILNPTDPRYGINKVK